jgi:hypothetical protein
MLRIYPSTRKSLKMCFKFDKINILEVYLMSYLYDYVDWIFFKYPIETEEKTETVLTRMS